LQAATQVIHAVVIELPQRVKIERRRDVSTKPGLTCVDPTSG